MYYNPEPSYAILFGEDNKRYAVFEDEFALDRFINKRPDVFKGCLIANFGDRRNNAFLLPPIAS